MSEDDETMRPVGTTRKRGGAAAADRSASRTSDARMDEERLDEREFEEREWDEDERLELFLETQHQTVLPNLPRMDGYHVCWLTTSNPRDSLQWRQRIGYELLRAENFPQWQQVEGSTGTVAGVHGCVTVNEMVAARIPITLYNKLLKAVGHYLPLKEEEKIRADLKLLRNRAKQQSAEIVETDSMADIVQRSDRPVPVFTE